LLFCSGITANHTAFSAEILDRREKNSQKLAVPSLFSADFFRNPQTTPPEIKSCRLPLRMAVVNLAKCVNNQH
jgi:hypothetical protein